jgi:hypothetical protein
MRGAGGQMELSGNYRREPVTLPHFIMFQISASSKGGRFSISSNQRM